jgi:hypothetical protein
MNPLFELEARQMAIAMGLDTTVLEIFCSEIRDARIQHVIHGERSNIKGKYSKLADHRWVHGPEREDKRYRNSQYAKDHQAKGQCVNCCELRDPDSPLYCTYHLERRRQNAILRESNRVLAGICCHCWRQLDPNSRRYCTFHLEFNRNRETRKHPERERKRRRRDRSDYFRKRRRLLKERKNCKDSEQPVRTPGRKK